MITTRGSRNCASVENIVYLHHIMKNKHVI
jgi:hypothetical protein